MISPSKGNKVLFTIAVFNGFLIDTCCNPNVLIICELYTIVIRIVIIIVIREYL